MDEPEAGEPREFGGLPDFNKIMATFDGSFDELKAVLNEMLTELREIKGEIRAMQQ